MKRMMSLPGTCSRFTKREVIQNRIAAPATLKVTISNPVIPCVMASFPNGAISPQKAHARNMERCASIWELVFFFIFFLTIFRQNNLVMLKFSAKLQTFQRKTVFLYKENTLKVWKNTQNT